MVCALQLFYVSPQMGGKCFGIITVRTERRMRGITERDTNANIFYIISIYILCIITLI